MPAESAARLADLLRASHAAVEHRVAGDSRAVERYDGAAVVTKIYSKDRQDGGSLSGQPGRRQRRQDAASYQRYEAMIQGGEVNANHHARSWDSAARLRLLGCLMAIRQAIAGNIVANMTLSANTEKRTTLNLAHHYGRSYGAATGGLA